MATLVVHGHFYQPPRENPWTEEVPREPGAAPFHDWNERITAECYRPNGVARVLDEHGRVRSIVNNYARMSFNIGPTLMIWLEQHAPDVYARILVADAEGGGAIAQAYGHAILPLANERDVRTQVRWGLADFAHRFGRPATGMWLPECAVNEDVLRVLAEEGVGFTILAPDQAAEPVDVRRPYRWAHPDGELGVDIVFYDGALSHDVAFGLGAMTSQAFVERVSGDGLVTVAADGETFGHHHRWGDRLLAYAFDVEAPARGVEVTNLVSYLAGHPAVDEVRVRESSWSCAHGVARWREDCGCSTGGEPGWNQRWRGPLREALDLLRDRAGAIYERRGAGVLRAPWAARDAYGGVLLGAMTREEFAAAYVDGDRVVEAFTLLESQRQAMSMYTSCGWFFNDLAGIETVQVLRYAARLIDLLRELGEDPGAEEFLERLAKAESNVAAEGNGRDIWRNRVAPSRVTPERVVAHLALVELLERQAPAPHVGGHDVEVDDHERQEGGALALCSGRVTLAHVRTGRRTQHAYAALHLGGLEVLGACRPWRDTDADDLAVVRAAFVDGKPVTTLLRLVSERFGPHEFGLESALPDAPEQMLEGAVRTLTNRFAGAFEQLFSDHRATLVSLGRAGYPLPPELRAPGELALARRLEDEVARAGGSLDPADYAGAVAVAREAKDAGLAIDTPAARATVSRLLLQASARAVAGPDTEEAVEAALAVLRVAMELGLPVDVEPAQEVVFAAGPDVPALRPLAAALNLAVSRT